MKKLVYLFIASLSFFQLADAYSQTIDPTKQDYIKIDDHARTLGSKYRDLGKLANDLTSGFSEDHEKVRAIFTWIASNINYDTKAFHKGSDPISFTYSSEEELQSLLAAENERVILEALKNNRAVCDGYSRLFKTLCEKSGIQAETIDGYARNNIEIGRVVVTNNSNHSWNSVLLYGNWYLLDPTWASGYADPGVTKFTRKFRSGYFLTPPDKFIFDHFPEDPKCQLLQPKITWDDFIGFPLVKAGFLEYNISNFTPQAGTIRTKANKSIDFEFTSDQRINEILIHQSNEIYSQEAIFDKRGDRFYFHYTIEKRGTSILTIFINGESALMYRVEVR